MNFQLSYIIATRNRLPFLKITIEKIIDNIQPDEEIVVVDGNSTDGAKEYLNKLFLDGKIHQFISEPDKNQAHAWNKAMLLAKGTIIKKIIDDDVFCYTAISKCKKFMLLNPSVDILISNDLESSLHNHKKIGKRSRLPQFLKWKDGNVPSFTFGDVHTLIRRSSLANIGLYNTDFIMMDWEYSLRISYLKAKIAYYTGYNALNVAHPQTVTALKNENFIKLQGKRACAFYDYPGDRAEITPWSKIKIFIGTILFSKKSEHFLTLTSSDDLEEKYEYFYNYLQDINGNQNFIFILS